MALAETIRWTESQDRANLYARLNVPRHWDSFMAKDVPRSYDKSLSTPDFLSHINNIAVEAINSPDYHDRTGQISDVVWKRLVKQGLLAAPLGERDPNKRQEEFMGALRSLSYHDISLGLTLGITTALAIMPFQRFSTSEEQRERHLDIIRHGERVGLAITELNKSGTTAMDMESNYTVNSDGTISLEFAKHCQGLSGNAGLIIAALEKGANTMTLGLFYVSNEQIDVTPTKMLGLDGVSYAVNKGKITLDRKHMMAELQKETLLRDFPDMFTKSRLLFIGMTLGHQERMEQEALIYANERMIGATLQANMEVPQKILGDIRARRIVTEAMFNRVINYRTEDGKSLMHGDTTKGLSTEASMVKALSTQLALKSAQDRAELAGSSAYYAPEGAKTVKRKGALQDFSDIWPFHIFEGTEDFLYGAIGKDVLRRLSKIEALKKAGKDISEEREIYLVDGAEMKFDNETEMRLERVRERIKRLEDEKRKSAGTPEKTRGVNKVHENIFGEISARKFALGCVELSDMSQEDVLLAKKFLNLEVKHLTDDFLAVE